MFETKRVIDLRNTGTGGGGGGLTSEQAAQLMKTATKADVVNAAMM